MVGSDQKRIWIVTAYYPDRNKWSSDLKESTTTYMTDFNGSYIIIKNVPCTQCTQCGEVYLNGATLMKIEKILERLKSALTEIAVVDYTQLAA